MCRLLLSGLSQNRPAGPLGQRPPPSPPAGLSSSTSSSFLASVSRRSSAGADGIDFVRVASFISKCWVFFVLFCALSPSPPYVMSYSLTCSLNFLRWTAPPSDVRGGPPVGDDTHIIKKTRSVMCIWSDKVLTIFRLTPHSAPDPQGRTLIWPSRAWAPRRTRDEAGRRRLLVRVVQSYNRLPLEIRDLSLKSFKREILQYLDMWMCV